MQQVYLSSTLFVSSWQMTDSTRSTLLASNAKKARDWRLSVGDCPSPERGKNGSSACITHPAPVAGGVDKPFQVSDSAEWCSERDPTRRGWKGC